MIETETLFVLGAGASADYGLPIGVELTKEIVDFLHARQDTFYDEFLKTEHDRNGFSKLARIIRNSRSPTIDAFIRDNDKYSDLLKAAIAGVLLRHEDHVLSDEKFPPRDWLAWMFHVKMASHPELFERNRVSFLSFNYDRIPEGLFARFMANTHEHDVLDAVDAVRNGYSIFDRDIEQIRTRFMHVHGRLESNFQKLGADTRVGKASDKFMLQTVDPAKPYDVEYLKGVSSKIVTISEPLGNSKRELVANIKFAGMFSGVRRVIILGIGYHEENLIRIGLDKKKCAELSDRLEFFGGTGVGVRGKERERIQKRLGQDFQLGDPDQDCLSFLQEFMD